MHAIFPGHRRKTIKTVLCFSELKALKEIIEFPETDSYDDKLSEVSGNLRINKRDIKPVSGMTTIFIRYSVSYSNVYLYYHLILHNLFKDP